MSRLRILSIFIVCGLILSSCDTGFYSLVSESTQDPSVSAPTVDVFDSLSGISLSWDRDPHADKYVVYRRLLSAANYDEVYRGTDLKFTDTNAQADKMYAYTLAKIRGSKLFDPGATVTGAWDANYVRDPNGSNDTKDTATQLGTDTVADNVFYYSTAVDALTGRQTLINDTDWFYVDLGPRTQLFFVFAYGNASQSGQLVVSTTSDTPVANGQEVSIFNAATTNQRVWFNVHYNPASASTGTQTLVNYQLVFNRITTYP